MYEREKKPLLCQSAKVATSFHKRKCLGSCPLTGTMLQEATVRGGSHKPCLVVGSTPPPASIYSLSEREKKKKKSEKDNQRDYCNRYLCLYRMEYPVLEPAGVGFNSYRFGCSYNSSENLHWIGS